MLVLVTLVAALGLAVASRRIFAPPGPVRGGVSPRPCWP